MSATWKAVVRPPQGAHQEVALFVSTEPDKWALGGTVRARVGDEADALVRRLGEGMPLTHPDRTPYEPFGPTTPDPETVLERLVEHFARLRHEATGPDVLDPAPGPKRGASPDGLVTWAEAREEWRETYRDLVRATARAEGLVP